MKKSIITIVVGLIWILTPQVAKSQTEQDGTANLKKYYTAIDRMHGKGAIKVEKAPRDYKGDIPFYEYYKMKIEDGGWDKPRALVSTFLDEKFVFDQVRRQEIITKLVDNENNRKKAFSYKAHADDKKIDDFLAMEPTDTFGLFINAEQRVVQFINLRTGKCYYLYNLDLNQLLESTTYLSKSPSIPEFQYDPSYSLTELFNYKWYYPDYPEKMCKALEGLEVYRTDINDYDVIKSVKVRRSDDWNGGPATLYYDVEYQNGKSEYGRNPGEKAFTIKWYEELKKCIGMKVIYCYNQEELLLYKDFVDAFPVWTLESVELGNLGEIHSSRQALVITIKRGQQTKRLDALYNGVFLTRKNIDLYPKDDKHRYQSRLLPYDYVEKHAVKMPESVKSELTWLAKSYYESILQSFREIWVGQKVSFFLSEFPNAKLVKNTVSGGKAIRIYHVKGNEFIFKDGVCTSVTKI